MRHLLTISGLSAVLAAGALLGSATAPAARSANSASACPAQPTTTTATTTTDTTATTTTDTTPTDTTTTDTTTTPAAPPHPLNQVISENCQSGTEVRKAKLQVAWVGGDNVNPENLAYAYSHDCASGCVSVAAAYQVVLVQQDAHSQTPQNGAIAVNLRCTGCGTFAYADQYVLDVPHGSHFTPGTRRQIAAIREQVTDDVNSPMPFATLDGKLKALASQLQQVIDHGLVQLDDKATHEHSNQHDRQQGGP